MLNVYIMYKIKQINANNVPDNVNGNTNTLLNLYNVDEVATCHNNRLYIDYRGIDKDC